VLSKAPRADGKRDFWESEQNEGSHNENFDGEKVVFGEDVLKSSVICYRVMD